MVKFVGLILGVAFLWSCSGPTPRVVISIQKAIDWNRGSSSQVYALTYKEPNGVIGSRVVYASIVDLIPIESGASYWVHPFSGRDRIYLKQKDIDALVQSSWPVSSVHSQGSNADIGGVGVGINLSTGGIIIGSDTGSGLIIGIDTSTGGMGMGLGF